MKLSIHQFILEEAKFAHRGDFLSFVPPTLPTPSPAEVKIELAKGEDPAITMVRVRVTNEPGGLYEFSVSYIALMAIDFEGAPPPDDLDKMLMMSGASMLFPFVREAVATLTMRGRFGPSWIAPVNLSAIVAGNTPPPQPAIPSR